MRKWLTVAMAALMVFGMAGWGNTATAETTAEGVIGMILVDYQKTFEETKDDLIANAGEKFNIGEGDTMKETSDEGLVLMAQEQENPMFYLERRLDSVEGLIDRNQAFHIRFKPSAKDFGFMMSADNNAGITIGEDSEPLLFVNFGEYREPLSGNIRIEPGQWYHALLAMDSNGIMQVAVWKDGEESKLAGAYVNIGQAFDNGAFQNQSWEMSVGFRGAATLTVDSYEYYTFSGFVMEFKTIEAGENQNGEMQNNGNDYGPQWAINIAGNFDIMSDMVWQSVEPQTINANGGDTFIGYNLADLMNFSGNGSSKASVVFGYEGAQTADVDPTFDAFIVFKLNGEFLGGPYLLSIDGLSENPVTEVHPE